MNALANTEAERILLASMLTHSEALHQALALGITATDFSAQGNRAIAAAMVQVGRRGEAVDCETVGAQLVSSGNGDKVRALLTDIADPLNVPRKNCEWHVRQVKDKARRRHFVAACQRAIAQAEDVAEETHTCVSALNESLLSLEAESSDIQAKHIREFLPEVIHELEIQSAQHGLVGMPTGIDALDVATGGIRPGQLWVVGALPGRGKTALAAQIALANAYADIPTAVFSLEMAQSEIAKRFLAAKSRISAGRLHNPACIGKQEWGELLEAAGDIAERPIWIDASSTLTVQELIARARLYIRRHGAKLIVVDYLRLVSAPGKELRERVAYVADALRQLAKTERVGVVLLSQLRRPESGINAHPSMIELKESGDIEAHAHVVLLLYMPIGSDGKPTGEEEIVIGKNRVGPVGSLPVFFDSKRLQFFDRQVGGRGQ